MRYTRFMQEKPYRYTRTDENEIEKLVTDDQVMVNHVVPAPSDRLAEHSSDSNISLVVVRGTLSIQLDDQPEHLYHDSIVNVPFHTKLNLTNTRGNPTEFFIVKAPHPRVCKAESV